MAENLLASRPDPRIPDPAAVERLLRERYEPICTAAEYQQLRAACGLGDLIDGEVVSRG